jgi:N utilization substance protein B
MARKFAMQALYQLQLNPQPADIVLPQFRQEENFGGADGEYFDEVVSQCIARREELDAAIAAHVDRPLAQLDPVEHAILLLAMYELTARPDVPYKVVINEAIALAKRFGATDGHRYVNAVLDRAAKIHRAAERH